MSFGRIAPLAGHVTLFDAPRFVNESLEDAAGGLWVERGLCSASQPVEQLPFAFGIVHVHPARSFVVPYLQHHLNACGDQREDLLVEGVDFITHGQEVWVCHGRGVGWHEFVETLLDDGGTACDHLQLIHDAAE